MPKRLISEMSRRRVFRGLGTYVVAAWVVLQIVDRMADPYDPIRRLALLMAVGGAPLAALFSWAFRVLPGVVEREDHGVAAPPRTQTGRLMDLGVIAGLGLIAVVEAARLIVR